MVDSVAMDFRSTDTQGLGTIEVGDIKLIFSRFGFPTEHLDLLLEAAGQGGKSTVDYGEFLRFLDPRWKREIVIVGYGPVGHAFLERLLEKAAKTGAQLQVTVLCEEHHAAYNRVKMTTFFEHRSPDRLALSSEDWCKSRSVRLLFARASKIDVTSRKVHFELNSNGAKDTVDFDDLVLATGSSPFVPPAPAGLGPRTEGIFVYRTLTDIFAIVERARTAKKAAVIGGGLLGLEAAKACYDLKLESHVIEMAPHLMVVQIDPEAGELVKSKVEALGVKVHCGTKTVEVLKGPQGVCGLRIDEKGREELIECDLVIVSAGVRPRHELAQACGLELGQRGGVKVDERMRSVSNNFIHAIGEVASLNGGMVYGLWAPGIAQAEVLSDHLASNPGQVSSSVYTGSDLSTKLKLMGVDVGSFGATADFWFGRLYNCTDQSKVMNLIDRDPKKGVYKKLVFTPDGKKLLGGILIGDNEDFAKLSALAKRPDLGGLTPQEVLDGKMPRVDDGGDGTNLGPEDLVCNCHSVTKATIVKAIQAGAGSFTEIKKCTKAGTGCGTCISTGPQPRLLAHTLKQLRRSMGISTVCPFSEQDVEDLAKARSLKTYTALLDQISYTGYEECSKTKATLQPILDRVFNGKKKGDGLDLVAQLKCLKKDLFQFVDQMNCNPIFVRLAWHDSGTYDKRISTWPERGGANGSIVCSPEIDHGANNGLSKAVKFLEPFKDEYALVSWADILQMASAVSIEHAGGPRISMRYGRRDISGSSQCVGRYSREGFADNAGLPDAEPPFGCGAPTPAQHLRNVFGRMGLDDKAIVALSGAHTLGRAFAERSGTVPEGYGESKACRYTKSIGVCPVRHDGAVGVGMPGGRSWTKQWLKFDNSYFKDYREKDPELAWFSTDRCLHDGSDAAFKQYFSLYADDQAAFFRDYAEAHKALSELGSEFIPPEGIVID